MVDSTVYKIDELVSRKGLKMTPRGPEPAWFPGKVLDVDGSDFLIEYETGEVRWEHLAFLYSRKWADGHSPGL